MSLSSLGKKLEKESNNEILDNAENLIDESIFTLKEISNKLSPHILINFGLLKAVKSFINKLQIPDKPQIHLNYNIEGRRFSYNIEVVLYRVICELIANTIKHAEAANVYIDLFEKNNTLEVKYIDDGIGFDLENLSLEESGMGYDNIESRLKSIDGDYEIFSRPNEGFVVKIVTKVD